jgi:hypothetical protein
LGIRDDEFYETVRRFMHVCEHGTERLHGSTPALLREAAEPSERVANEVANVACSLAT